MSTRVNGVDFTTLWCDIQTARFRISSVKILEYYPNGDARIYAPNGVQFTAKAEEIFNLRVGDYHAAFLI